MGYTIMTERYIFCWTILGIVGFLPTCSAQFKDFPYSRKHGNRYQAPPILANVSPSYLIQKEGATVDLFCDATATPEPTLTWYKDGREIIPSDKLVLHGNGVEVSDLVREDGGVYTCTFKNTVGQVSHVIKLVIEGNAYIMVPPKNTTISDGLKAKLQCQAEGYPNNITYRWYKDTVDVSTVPGLMDRAGIYADGSFVIKKVEKEDTGWYICRPTNGLGPPPEAKAYLNVTYLPYVLSMPLKTYLPKGMLGKIECPTEANPPVTTVLWRKDRKQIDFSQTTRMMSTKRGTLVIKEVTKEDEGHYQCSPISALGSGKSSTPVQVLVRDPPHFVVRPEHTYQRIPGQQVVMHCMADGDPVPRMSWRKADGSFPSSRKTLQDGGNLTIVNLSREDHGTYECVASNIVTTIVTATLLLIELSPLHAPYNLTVTTAQLSATITWLPAYDGSGPYHYVVWYKKKNSQENWQTLQVVPDGATSMTIHRLQSDTVYQFIVLSRNSEGEAKFSNIHTAKTKGDRSTFSSGISTPSTTPYRGPFPDPPYNLTVRQNAEEQLNISWNAPRNSPIPVLYYVIQFRTVGQWVNLTNKIVGTWFLWKTVSRSAHYYFRVYSYGDVGRSTLPSKTVTFETKDPMDEGVRISPTVIASFIGGLVALFFLCILIVLGTRYIKRRKKRAKHMRYGNGKFGNVKYFGPKTVEAGNKQITAFDIQEKRGEPAGGNPLSPRGDDTKQNMDYSFAIPSKQGVDYTNGVRIENVNYRSSMSDMDDADKDRGSTSSMVHTPNGITAACNMAQVEGVPFKMDSDHTDNMSFSKDGKARQTDINTNNRERDGSDIQKNNHLVSRHSSGKDGIIPVDDNTDDTGLYLPEKDYLKDGQKTDADDHVLVKVNMMKEPDSDDIVVGDAVSKLHVGEPGGNSDDDKDGLEYPTLPCRSKDRDLLSAEPEVPEQSMRKEVKVQETQTQLVPTADSEDFAETDSNIDEEEAIKSYCEEVLTM